MNKISYSQKKTKKTIWDTIVDMFLTVVSFIK